MDPDSRPSPVPVAMSVAGFGLVLCASMLAWVYPHGDRQGAPNGFDGGWVTAHLRGQFAHYEWTAGADAWLTLVLSLAAVALAVANLRARERRYDRAQFALGLLVVAIVVYNWFWIMHFAGEHMVSDADAALSDFGADRPGAGLWLALLGGVATSAGALLGNTPEYHFAPDGGEAPEALP